MSAWRGTGDDWYLAQAEALAGKTHCEPGPNAMNDANDLNISQTYLELYESGKAGQYKPTQLILDSLIKNYNPEKIEWSWCDALFMAPPTWARMGKITGNQKYFEHMDKLWWQTCDLIFDKNAWFVILSSMRIGHRRIHVVSLLNLFQGSCSIQPDFRKA